MLAFHWIFFKSQKQVCKVDRSRKGCPHLMRHVRAVHRRQPVLRLEVLQLLNVSYVLNENNNSCQILVAQFLDALLVNLIILDVLEGSQCAKIID